MFQKLLAGITAAALCCTMPGLYWAASAEEQQPTVKTIQLDKSDRLSGTGGTKPIPESQITGRISVSVQDNPVHLKVTKYSSEKPSDYYDLDLAPADDADITEYVLLLDYNEVPLDPSLFRNTYTTQALTCTYASVYNVTISEPATDDAVFEDKNVIIADPKSEASVVGNSTYYYSVTFPDGMDTPVSATSARSEITDDGDWNVSREISLLYRPYALGDVDNSGKIDATDTFYLMYYIALRAVGQEPPAEVVPEACDIDKNGTVDSTDLFYLMVYIAYGGAGMPLTFDQIVSGNF